MNENIGPWMPKLLYMRSSQELAKRLLEFGTEQDAGHALVIFDGAVETLLSTGLKFLCERKSLHGNKEICALETKEPKVTEFIVKLNKATASENLDLIIPVNDLDCLHKMRNLTQHHANLPRVDTVENLVDSISVNFLEPFLEKVFHVRIDEISMGILIRNLEIRRLFLQSEAKFRDKDYLESLIYSVGALELGAHIEAEYKLGGHYSPPIRIDSLDLEIDRRSEEKLYSALNNISEFMNREFELLKLGLEPKKIQILRQAFSDYLDSFSISNFLITYWENLKTSDIEGVFSLNDNKFLKKMRENFDKKFSVKLKELAQLSLDFCLENVLRWERVPRESYMKFFGYTPIRGFETDE